MEFPGRGGFAAEAQFRRFFFRGSRELGESLAEWAGTGDVRESCVQGELCGGYCSPVFMAVFPAGEESGPVGDMTTQFWGRRSARESLGRPAAWRRRRRGGTACWESLFLMPSPRWSIRVPPGPLRSFRDVEKNFFQRPFDASLRKSRGGGKKAGRREKKREKDGGGIAGARSTAGFRLFLWGYFLSHSCPLAFHQRQDSRHQYSVTIKASFS